MNGRPRAGACALLACLAGIGATAGTAAAASAGHAKPAPAPTVHYYVALGDSLSVGFQPNAQGVGVETKQGYTNDLYAVAKRHIKNLKLVELGCPGETTTSMITGKGNLAAKLYHCKLTGGSQLKAAEAFLKAHDAPGEVPLITLDIGANDVDGCAADAAGGFSAVLSCVTKGVTAIAKDTPKILAGIKSAAPRGTTLDAMNLYDPILADALSTDQSAQTLATASISLDQEVNATIQKADNHAGFRTANVAKAFNTYVQTPISTAGTPLAATGLSTVPTDVADICSLTWMCAPAPVGPNIHANKTGYALIASAFEAILPRTIKG